MKTSAGSLAKKGHHRAEGRAFSARQLNVNLLALALLATLSFVAGPAHASHAVLCRADLPVHPNEPMIWRAIVSGGSGNFSFSWTGNDGLTGSSEVITRSYTTAGLRFARVSVTDTTSGDVVQSDDCHSHVIPASFSEPPTVNPVLWVPNDVDPAPLVPHIERAWRAVQAAYVDQYGRTFRMNPLTTIISPFGETDICGGDCTELGRAGQLMGHAWQEAQATIGNVIPYTRAIHVLAWGAGGFAGSFGWDHPLGGLGDWAIGSVTGVQIPPIDAGFHDAFAPIIGRYSPFVSDIAHELNHAIGWDDPHDFTLGELPNDYEKQFSLAGPWLTETPADVTDPVVSFSVPAPDAVVSGTITVSADASDETNLDAVVFLVGDRLRAVDKTGPFAFEFDTTRVGFGIHQLQAIAYDDAGNATTTTRTVTVHNRVAETSCSRSFPTGVFHACFFDGTNLDGPYLGTLLDTPFPVPSTNLGAGIIHSGSGEVAFGRSDTVSGVWRGTLTFPKGNYILSFLTNDGLRVKVNGVQILDEWREQHAVFAKVVALDGPTRIQIEWFDNGGEHHLHFRWHPTAQQPPITAVTDFPESIGVNIGALVGGNASRLRADDNNYLRVGSARTGTTGAHVSSWVGRFLAVRNDLQDLRVTYKGKNTRNCSQSVAIRRWTTNTWVQLNSRSVGTTEVAIRNLVPPGSAADFVSNTSGTGTVSIRVRCQAGGGSFVARGDLLKLDYRLPGDP